MTLVLLAAEWVTEIFQPIVLSVLGIVLIGFISWGIKKLIDWINSKISNEEVANLLTSVLDIVETCVEATYQTYVEELKDKDMFTADAQKEALSSCLDTIKATLTTEATEYISKNYGDIDTWLTTQIESTIYELKNEDTTE